MKIEEDIGKVLDAHEEVQVAYLFGSTARKTSHEDSDLDIGLLLDEEFEPDALYTSRISGEIEKKIKPKRTVDVRIMNEKPITFQHQVLKYGKQIFVRDEKERIKFETYVYDRYLDYKPFFEQYNRIRRKRILP